MNGLPKTSVRLPFFSHQPSGCATQNSHWMAPMAAAQTVYLGGGVVSRRLPTVRTSAGSLVQTSRQCIVDILISRTNSADLEPICVGTACIPRSTGDPHISAKVGPEPVKMQCMSTSLCRQGRAMQCMLRREL
jgi:hypothetical protein